MSNIFLSVMSSIGNALLRLQGDGLTIASPVAVRRLCLLLLSSFTVFVTPVYAENYFAFILHPQATVFEQTTYPEKNYIIALDKYRKVDNRWVPRKWQRQSGQLQRYTLEMPRDYVEEDVFKYYDDQLPNNAQLLFGCDGRRCGESNNWANDHFGIKQLYGTDTSQYYRAYQIPSQTLGQTPADVYVTLYTVRRGNRRLYVQLDVLYPR